MAQKCSCGRGKQFFVCGLSEYDCAFSVEHGRVLGEDLSYEAQAFVPEGADVGALGKVEHGFNVAASTPTGLVGELLVPVADVECSVE